MKNASYDLLSHNYSMNAVFRLEIKAKAREMGIPTYVVADAGHTQIEAGSLTVCGLGPCTTKQV